MKTERRITEKSEIFGKKTPELQKWFKSDSKVAIKAHNKVIWLRIKPMVVHTKFKTPWWHNLI